MTEGNPQASTASPTTSLGHLIYTEFYLENGLRVVLHEDHKAPVVCLNIVVHVGSKNESENRRGFAHLFEHLMFDGSKNVPRGDFDVHITKIGGHDNAYTTEDKTSYYEVLPSHELELGLWLESDRMLEFGICAESLITQKSVVKEEKRERYDNAPYGSLSIRMNRLAYSKFAYWWAVIGDMDTIDAATLHDVREFYEAHYVPENCVLVLAGDFDPAKATELIEKYFGEIPRGKKPLERPVYDEPLQLVERRELIKDEAVPLPGVFYGYKIPPDGTHEFAALDLLTDILASGQSSRLYQNLVYDQQIASDANAYVDGREMPGLCYIYAIGSDLSVPTDALEAALNSVLNDVAANGVTDTELMKAKNKTIARIVSSRVTVQGKADQLAHSAVFYGDVGRVNTMAEEYERVTTQDVVDAARKYLIPQNRSTVVYLHPEANTEAQAELTEIESLEFAEAEA